MTSTGFVYDKIYLEHDTGFHHPERAERLTAILEALEEAKLLDKLFHIAPAPAEKDVLELCHDPYYIDNFKTAVEGAHPFLYTPECPLSPATYEVALHAVGGVLKGIDRVMEGVVKNCFCAVRPPGHHAERSKAMGFCYFNNVAIAARYLQTQYAKKRILIIDWDVHHGNGTQHFFENDPTVFYVSFHQDPSYSFPGTGWAAEKGNGKGKGYTQNFPLAPYAGEKEYLEAMEKVDKQIEDFKPQFILISAGFDAHMADPLAHIQLTTDGYGVLTRKIKDMAATHAEGRLVSVLEGGYDLKALGESVTTHIEVLMETKFDTKQHIC